MSEFKSPLRSREGEGIQPVDGNWKRVNEHPSLCELIQVVEILDQRDPGSEENKIVYVGTCFVV